MLGRLGVRAASTLKGKTDFDLVVVGGGIVGTAAAREIQLRHPNLKMAVVEKEASLAQHQSRWNSGVLHAGIYYTPGSLKAQLCVKGIHMVYDYADRKGVPYKRLGKLIVAVREEEVARLDGLYERAQQNGVRDVELVPADRIRDFEPHAQGLKALWSPHTGIMDFPLLAEAYARDFVEGGGEVRTATTVQALSMGDGAMEVHTDKGPLRTAYLVTCCGLHSDRVAGLSGCDPSPKIVPFRGEWLRVAPEKAGLVKGNIYPVPNPAFPFLGVHFTPKMNGELWVGPNAVLAAKREGYGYGDVSLRDLADALGYRGMQRLLLANVRFGVGELWRSLNKRAQMAEAVRYVPSITARDVVRGDAGVRAQALDVEGNLVEDFVWDSGKGELGKRILHLRNAPSPAATSSLAIAELIADKVRDQFALS